ncbi:T9SS type A sorting domain-containing protein [Dyadobacter jiangsuensis]|uniref:Putative secreted protein (Por secretion system target) n=1 Tax=Dyadobacter jiangsuensis TaxID=1591085 RepID=A0A2P8FI86_9BACT|nr:T9SS type A sorting domain-containing protein [Dyadobacter jiangsuensis]PSL21420.1 putative secreted protein (Por secretion system target) [Dyadobacter jiangsuensis]
MKSNFTVLTRGLLWFLLLSVNHSLFAQLGCYSASGCQDYGNFGYASTVASNLEYDNYVSGWHSSAVRDIDGSFKVWGELSKADGAGAHLIPTEVNATNYPGLTGTPLKMGVGTSSRNNVQYVLLTSDNKLWVWGRAGAVVDAALTTNVNNVIVETGQPAVNVTPFQQLSIGLPAGITAANVKMMFVTSGSIMITTCGDGRVYTLSQSAWVRGVNGGNNLSWNVVQKQSGGDLTDIVAARGTRAGVVALDNSGGLWAYGAGSWDGIAATSANRTRAVPLTLPPAVAGAKIKMIGATIASTNTITYYVLYEDGSLFALGGNDRKQLGNWDPTNANQPTAWTQPRYTSASGPVMNDIKWISPQEHDGLFSFINVLTNGQKIFNWGQESGYALGRGVHGSVSGSTPVDPGEPVSFEAGYANSGIISLESGGHTTMMLRECEDDFGYIGHRIHGSMGDNIDTDVTDNTVHFRTSAVQVCGAVTTDASLTVSSSGPFLSGSSVTFVGAPSGGTYAIDASLTTAAGATIDPVTGIASIPSAGTLRVNYIINSATCGAVVVNQLVNVERMISIPGNVWIDANGDAIVDGTESGTANGLWANLIDPQGKVVASVEVAADGSYNIEVRTGLLTSIGDYSVVLTNGSRNIGDTVTAADTPLNGYEYTGTNRGGTTSVTPSNNTGTINLGSLNALPATTTTLDPVNFGIQTPPVADPKSYTVPNVAFSATPQAAFPVEAGYQSIPASSSSLTGYPTGGSLSGSDAEDCAAAGTCATGTSTTFTIHSINANTLVYYDFGGVTGIQQIDVSGGPVTIPDFNVNSLVVYGQVGSGTAGNEFGFTYSMTDAAGATSSPVAYSIATESALPVTLISFEASAEKNAAHLAWATTSEENSRGFEIERSTNASNWTKIGFVASKSSETGSTSRLDYDFTDASVHKGVSYYRLKMVDNDGTFAYSQIRSLRLDGGDQLLVYPNPVVDGKLTIGPSGASSYRIEVNNLAGTRVMQLRLENQRQLDVRGLARGMYILRIISASGETQTCTFFVK